jgi:Zn-dependent protease with chaperone function
MHAKELRTPEERNRYRFALVFSILAWIAIVVSIVGVVYAALAAVVILIGHALFLAHVRGNGVQIGPEQMPELWNRVTAAAKKLGLETTPDTYILQAGGMLNAFATKLFARKFVIIFSDLVDACEAAHPSLGQANEKPTELDFVIAHELGHIACGHLNWLLLPARIVPLLGPAYSRACEYTCDACGDAVADDPDVSMRALSILASGGHLGARLNLTAFAAQRKTARPRCHPINDLDHNRLASITSASFLPPSVSLGYSYLG